MEASTIPVTAAPAPERISGAPRLGVGPLLRLRSDEQLVRHFRAGSEEAFRVIHDRYRARLFAYARQMLGGSRADAEDALQDVFVRAYAALRANQRDVSLRAWLYRIAHNRCIDELRRPGGAPAAPAELLEQLHAPASDPMDAVERRESLRRLVADVQRLPEQQRSALLMREISGMAYADLAAALDVTVPAVKSLLVRARIGLAQAAEARDTACAAIRADLADAHERGVRASGLVRRHLHDCTACSAYRRELRVLDARLAALVPALGPVALLAKLLGIGGGAAGGTATAGATAAGSGAAVAGAGAASVSITHIAAAVAVAVVSAGGAVEVHQTFAPVQQHHHRPVAIVRNVPSPAPAAALHVPLAVSDTASAALARERQAALRADAERRRARALAEAGRGAPADPAATPPLDPSASGPGNGGAAAPLDPSTGDTPQPVLPPQDASAAPAVGATSGTNGSSPPTSGAPANPPAAPAPSATTAIPAPLPAPTTPPTSATTGGATYRPGR